MIKRLFLAGVILILIPLLVVGCDIAQEEYDAILAARDTATAEVTSLLSQVESLKSEVDELRNQIETLKSSSSTEQSQLSSFKSELKSTWTSLAGLLEVNDIILDIASAGMLDNMYAVKEESDVMVEKLAALGDSELQALWEKAYVVEDEQWNLHWAPAERFIEALAERIRSDKQALSDKLEE